MLRILKCACFYFTLRVCCVAITCDGATEIRCVCNNTLMGKHCLVTLM